MVIIYRKKFKTIDELFSSEEFKKKDLSYCDLEGLDLSQFDYYVWQDFLFYYTNFTGTNICFYPKLLKEFFHDKLERYSQLVPITKGDLSTFRYWKIEYCNFTDCDLSYLDKYDFIYTSVMGSNFTNTNFQACFTPYYGGFTENFLGKKNYSDVVFPNEFSVEGLFDVLSWKTIRKNSNIFFSSDNLLSIFRADYLAVDEIYLSERNIKRLNLHIEELLEEDNKREGNLVRFYTLLNDVNPFNERERILFFLGKVIKKDYMDIDFSSFSLKLLNKFCFENCRFHQSIFPNNYEKCCSFSNNFKDCMIEYVCFPTLNYHSWKDLPSNRIEQSRITFYRNLYLELGRVCNGKCKFCRNQYLKPCKYDLNKVKKSLQNFRSVFDTIVVGGGEPTLLLQDLHELQDSYSNNYVNWTVFTNASLSLEELIELNVYFNLNISRHSVEDDVNNAILGVHSLDTESLRKLNKKNLNHFRNLTLCPTCFKGEGIDTVGKIEDYIDYAYDLQFDHLLFQTLHKDLSMDEEGCLLIDEEIFDEVIAKLREQNYEIVPTIYSTGNYKLILARNGKKSISFKKYITKEELEREWSFALKRTFDFSMDPSGNLYENFHQNTSKVYVKR